MPNYCDNVIYVDGTDEVKAKLRAIFESNQEPFQVLVPEPDYSKVLVPYLFPQFHNEPAKVGRYDACIDWCVQNWGTKAEPITEVEVFNSNPLNNGDEDMLAISFCTAWSPPVGICKAISKLEGVKQVFNHYGESGNDFVGSTHFKDGEITNEFVLTFQDMDEKYREGERNPIFVGVWSLFEDLIEDMREGWEEAEEEEDFLQAVNG